MRILIVDDEKNIRYTLMDILRDEGNQVDSAETGEKCLSKLEKQHYNLIILDVRLPGMDGLEVFKKIKEKEIDTDVVMISGNSDIETAVTAVQMGAYNFLEKPLSMAKILTTIRNISNARALLNKTKHIDTERQSKYQMIGESPQILKIRSVIQKVAATDTKVLIRGESGTGKELVAWAIHQSSQRRHKAFIAFNSAAIPGELVESELFGYEKGAFTGAEKRKIGKLEMAHHGTLFLDEIGDMTIETQAKILRVIQEGTFERVGGHQTIDIDVRILAATHKSLEEMITKGTFREDLFYRLNVLPITVPPLREREGDIPILAEHYLQHFSVELNFPKKTLSQSAMALLSGYDFPGNIRELRNLIERLYILVDNQEIRDEDILPHLKISAPAAAQTQPAFNLNQNFATARREFDIQFLTRCLEQNSWNISLTAEKLGMRQPNLSRKIKELGIKRNA
ncbi:MAG: sigma-54-dependent Fis family transcriptional regulator [FCB group bacterium]|nr:sigma-54-dependent Fis family transcriptional regulator [FCB group bacterium]